MTTLLRAADTAFTYTLAIQDSSGTLVTPTGAVTATMYTDAARTAGAVALTVTATAQPQVFTVTGPPTLQGQRYLKHLIPTATGTRVDADDDLLFQAIIGAVDQGLVSVDEVKKHLGQGATALPATNGRDDAELQTLIQAASERIQQDDLAGPVTPRTVTRNLMGRGGGVVLPVLPALSVTTVTRVGSTDPIPAAEVAEDLASLAFYSGEYRTSLYDGRRLTVTYVAGRASTPYVVRYAVLELVCWWWRARKGGNPSFDTIGDQSIPTSTAITGVMHRRLREILGTEAQMSGIA